jgi:hypothetical protein
MTREERVRRLAAAFSRICHANLGEEIMARIVEEKNAMNYPVDCCPTHDYCDANELMHEAFVETFGYEPTLPCDVESKTDHEILVDEMGHWNDAWALAMEEDYDEEKIR